MQRGCLLVIFLYAGLVFPCLHAGASPVITLDNALEWGLQHSFDLQKSLIDLSAAEFSANRLWSEVFPNISGSLGTSYSTPVFSDGRRDGIGYSAGFGVNLTLHGGIPSAMRNISLAYQARLLSYEDARNQLGIQLTRSFYSLVADRDNLIVLADTLQLAQMQYERNQVAFNNGLVGETTLIQSRLGMENARFNLSTAQLQYRTRLDNFLAQLGIEHGTQAVLEGIIDIARVELDADRLIMENLPRRPDIVSRRQEITRLENAERQTALSVRAPSVSLSAQWNSRNFAPFADTFTGSATLNIPVDPWISGTGRNQSIRNAQNAVEKARLDLLSAENAALTQIRSLAAGLTNSWDNIEIARLSVSVAERGYELTEQGFRSGTVDSLRLENARNDLAASRQRLLQSEFAYLNMILDISAALNVHWKDLMQ